ncbi:MAG: hypothetical protein M1834_007261 [Cirrosporium novae-zelandiae]|nr:MAG: hypothetical protein M1834_007261 [Cirrosporium novae-zelandiae]
MSTSYMSSSSPTIPGPSEPSRSSSDPSKDDINNKNEIHHDEPLPPFLPPPSYSVSPSTTLLSLTYNDNAVYITNTPNTIAYVTSTPPGSSSLLIFRGSSIHQQSLYEVCPDLDDFGLFHLRSSHDRWPHVQLRVKFGDKGMGFEVHTRDFTGQSDTGVRGQRLFRSDGRQEQGRKWLDIREAERKPRTMAVDSETNKVKVNEKGKQRAQEHPPAKLVFRKASSDLDEQMKDILVASWIATHWMKQHRETIVEKGKPLPWTEKIRSYLFDGRLSIKESIKQYNERGGPLPGTKTSILFGKRGMLL